MWDEICANLDGLLGLRAGTVGDMADCGDDFIGAGIGDGDGDLRMGQIEDNGFGAGTEIGISLNWLADKIV